MSLRRSKPLHIGIVGCSAEGAALCYRTICTEAPRILGPHAHPEVSMHTPSFAEYVERLDRKDLRGVADLMLDSSRRLAAAGADFLICPDNSIHVAFGIVEPESPLPWLHIARIVAEEAVSRGFRKIGITGTRWLVDSEVYPDQLGARKLEFLRPDDADRKEVHRVIMDELVPGRIVPESVDHLLEVLIRLRDRGCDAVVLGCTELPIVLGYHNAPIPTLDSTRLLARAAIRRAI